MNDLWSDIERIVARHSDSDGASIQVILDELADSPPRRTVQYRLKQWVEQGRLLRTGERRGVRYFLPIEQPTVARTMSKTPLHEGAPSDDVRHFPYSEAAQPAIEAVRKPLIQRQPVGYDIRFLNDYRPNHSAYLTPIERDHLAQFSEVIPQQPAGTYARQLINRLLIDLSWNSSRLEGNTYSLLDTHRLIQFGAEAKGKASFEAQMIINHKEAIEFLIDSVDDIGFNRYTLLNLHALLSNNLLPDPQASGRLRYISVGIGHSTFEPLDVPQRIEESFDQLLHTAAAINNPFEQAFFILVQLPYLQPFDDVNKRVSRLAANIPFIQNNLLPLAFTDLPQSVYIEAILAVYELNAIHPLKDVFMWAYERSAAQYKAVQQTLGEPDAFRLRYREQMKTLVSDIVSQQLNKPSAYHYLTQWITQHIPAQDQLEFETKIEQELLGLHEGNFARYRIRPQAFTAWQAVWSRPIDKV